MFSRRDGGAAERARFEIVLCRNVYKGSNPFLCAINTGTVLPFPYLFVFDARKGFEGGGASESERFAVEMLNDKKVCRKLDSTVCCQPGRAAKGANPFLCAIKNPRKILGF